MTAMLFTVPRQRALDANANPVSGARAYFYQTGTTTALTVYQDRLRTVPHAQPVVADSAGWFPPIYPPDGTYKLHLKDGHDVELWPAVDDVAGPLSASTSSSGNANVVSVGFVALWFTSDIPAGWLECAGQAVSRTAYPDLFAKWGTKYGAGDGVTTFNLLDMRGEFPRGWDHGRGIDPDRAARTNRGDGTTGDNVGTKQGFVTVTHSHQEGSLGALSAGDHAHTGVVTGGTTVNVQSGAGTTVVASLTVGTTGNAGAHPHTLDGDSALSIGQAGGTETRPRNIAVAFCVLASAAEASAATLGVQGLQYSYDTSTAASDPGAGYVRFNTTTLSSVASMYISKTDLVGASNAGFMATWDDSTNTFRGTLQITKIGAAGAGLVADVSGAITGHTSWVEIPLTPRDANGTLTINDKLAVHYTRTGDQGAGGPSGVSSFKTRTGAVVPGPGDYAFRTAVADSNTTAVATGQTYVYTSLTAVRTVTLPAASAMAAGQAIEVLDQERKAVGPAAFPPAQIKIVRAGTDTINGQTAASIGYPGQRLRLISDGVSKYSVMTDAPWINVRHWGAVGDASTDDRAAIKAAIDACPAGGVVYFPPGRYAVSADPSGGAFCLNMINPVNLIGDGQYSAIYPLSSVGSTISTLRVAPAVGAYDFTNWRIENLTFGDFTTGTRYGNHGIFLDTLTAGAQLRKARITGCCIYQGSGSAIRHDNIFAGLNINGGLYAARIENNVLIGGISLNTSGDSNAIHNNVISGTGSGVYANLVSGASELEIKGNNITSVGGAIVIDSGSRFRILDNNCEQIVAGGSNNAMIDINGTGGTMSTGLIHGNHLGAFGGSGITANIRIRNCVNVRIDHNVCLPASPGQKAIDIATSLGTQIGRNTYGTGLAAPFVADTAPASTVTPNITPQIFTGNSNGANAAGATTYFWNQLNATESVVYAVIPKAGFIRDLYVYTAAAPGVGQTYTFTARLALADTALTCQISGAGSNSASDTTHAVAVAAGDRISIKVVSSAGAGSTGNIVWGLSYEPIASTQSDL